MDTTEFQKVLIMINNEATLDQIRALREVTHDRFRRLESQKKYEFVSGDLVEFEDKCGNLVCGRIERRKLRNLVVIAEGTGARWTVGPTLLRLRNLDGHGS